MRVRNLGFHLHPILDSHGAATPTPDSLRRIKHSLLALTRNVAASHIIKELAKMQPNHTND